MGRNANVLKVMLPADVNSVRPGAEVRSLVDQEMYVVGSRELCVDEQGKLIFELTLRPAKPRWIKSLDKLSMSYPVLPQVFGILVLAILAVPVMVVFGSILYEHDVPLALAGWAIVYTPWAIPLICTLAVFFRAWQARRRIGLTIAYVVSFIALMAGGGLGLLWHALFVPITPTVWPTDYVHLANAFSQSATKLIAVVAVYAPAILLVLKVLKFDSLGEIAGSMFRKKTA